MAVLWHRSDSLSHVNPLTRAFILNWEHSERAKANAESIRKNLPEEGLFADLSWRTAIEPFALEPKLVRSLEKLGRILLQFYRALDLLYRQSQEQRAPHWVAQWLEAGKPRELIDHALSKTFRHTLPKVIRPDILLTEEGFIISELDSVPGGIGLTAWLNQAYSKLDASYNLIGGARGMLDGFSGIFGPRKRVRIIVSQESATYRPEMAWLCEQIKDREMTCQDEHCHDFEPGEAVYRFFELFDLPQIPVAKSLLRMAADESIVLTPPPKPHLEEKSGMALLHNHNLSSFWHQHLGGTFFETMKRHVPYTWMIDPTPLPPQGALPGLPCTDWHQLKNLSQRERHLILKVSGFSERAWGSRGVYLGSDLSSEAWSEVVDQAIRGFGQENHILQRYHKPRSVDTHYYDFETQQVVPMTGRVRLCPYYFVHGEGDQARATLQGIMATICPNDKKIIHGMTDAVIAPCSKKEFTAARHTT